MKNKMFTLYHNPRCRKSREAFEFMKSSGVEYRVREYMKEPFTFGELENLLVRLNKKPQDIIRTQEKDYKSKFRNKNFTETEWIKILLEYPNLIRRPIIATGLKAVIAENIEELKEFVL